MIAQNEEELKENEKQDFIAGVFDNEDGSSTTEVKREYSIELDYLTGIQINWIFNIDIAIDIEIFVKPISILAISIYYCDILLSNKMICIPAI